MYELSHDLMNDLISDIRKLGNLKEIHEKLGPQPASQKPSFDPPACDVVATSHFGLI